MKITKMEIVTYKLNPNRGIPWNLLKVYTDEGLVGYGEPVLEGRAKTVKAAVEELGDYIIGKDPRQIERLWQDMYKGSFYRGGCILGSAVSGVEQALWDITGKWFGVPVWKLMGGRVRDRIRMYAHTPALKADGTPAENPTTEDWVRGALARKKEGFNAIKTGGTDGPLRIIDTPETLLRLADKIGAMREAVGPDFDIGIDLHGRFSPAMAKLYIKEVEQYKPMFFEEPVLPGNHDSMAQIARMTHIPIATGERLYTRWDFKDIVEKRAAALLQPDVCHAGGILELRKIAAYGEVNHCGLAPHNPMGAVALAASFAVAAGAQNFVIQEHTTLGEGVLKEPFELDKDGYIPLSEKPGLGIEIDDESIAQLEKNTAGPHLPMYTDRDDGSFGTW